METPKKDVEFWLLNQNNLKELCQTLSEVWNSLCSEHGWPHKKSWQDMLRERKAVRSLARQYALEHSQEEVKSALFWILSRWNWQKTPAPLNLLTSKTQWNCYRMVLDREREESEIIVKEKQTTLQEWAKMEINNRIRKGTPPDKATKETIDFALILGKLKGMNTEEKLSFCNFCENIERIYSNKS
jgi:hypothetical protein